MNKENGVGQLSDEQRARISRNFRAAKALRDRKRHRGTCYASNSFPQKIDVEIPSVVGGVNRVPLSDISVNTPTTVKHFKLNDGESVRESHFKASSIGKSDGRLFTRTIVLQDKSVKDHSSFQTPIRQINYRGNSCANEASISRFDLSHNSSIPNQNGSGLDSFRTQVRPFASNISSENSTVAEKQKPKDYSGSASFVTPMGEQSFSSLSEPSTVMPTIFYEDFDDSILAEIDAICESRIKSKVVSQDSSSDIQLKSGHPKPNSCELKTKVGPVVLENLQSDKVLDGSNDSGSTEGMPEDYAKYMKSLNESGLDSFKTPIRPSASNVSSENSTVAEKKGPKDYSGLASFVTPMGEQSSSSLSEPSTIMPTIFHEDFDDSILAEIDAICESGIKSKAVSQDSSSDIQLKSVHTKPNSCEFKTEVAPAVLEKLQSDKVLDGSSDSGLTEGMPEDYAKYMKSLNDRQREAACSDIAIPLMIVAGPGSGKTSTMVGRVLMLLHKGIEASNILAMTFTTAAASEMRDRIGSVAGKTAAKELMISTFHSFSLQLCRLHAEKLGRTPEFLLYGQGQQRKAVIEAVRLTETGKNLQISESDKLDNESSVTNNCLENFREKSKKWLKFVTQAKASGKTSEDYEGQGNSTGAAILRKYEDILKSCNALDYHDLISCSVKLLTGFPEVFTECQESWQAIVIDEFQDTSTMQYDLLRCLASHKRITIVGDEDQSIFSFNGADVSGFKSFRRDFQPHKEIRLNKNYRSTRYIVDAASCLIRNNSKRCQLNKVITDNSSGSKIVVKECCNEDAQCSFVVDKILELSSSGSSVKGTFGEIAVLYRRQVSGKMFQTSFRERKIPFNVHGVAFYRKKVVRAIISMLKTTMVVCDDESFRRVFKALLNLEKDEKKRIIDHINKVSTVRKCSFIATASDVFSAKISGTFKRSHLAQGRKVLVTLGLISKLVYREQSISTVIRSVANMIPQKYLLEQRAVVDVDGGKLLNEEHDIRSVLQYLLDDVSEFLKSYNFDVNASDNATKEKGCANVLKEFIDFISERETENFRVRRHDNNHAVTLTTIHQSKGLEWDTVFIVKANESEIPLLHEYNGITKETCSSLEEERRLLYVAMTRARKKLFILHVTVDSNWQVLQPSRFLKEIPKHLLEIQDESSSVYMQPDHQKLSTKQSCLDDDPQASEYETVKIANNETANNLFNEDSKESIETILPCNGNDFLKRFSSEERATVSHLFHQWAKKAAFKEPKRLLDKVAFVIDERLRVKKTAQKDVLRSLKSCLKSNEAFQYAENVLRWLQIPADKRAYITREKQEHFQKLRIESAMGSSEATSKQIAYLQSLGCTTVPSSRLHASRLIEQYKSL